MGSLEGNDSSLLARIGRMGSQAEARGSDPIDTKVSFETMASNGVQQSIPNRSKSRVIEDILNLDVSADPLDNATRHVIDQNGLEQGVKKRKITHEIGKGALPPLSDSILPDLRAFWSLFFRLEQYCAAILIYGGQ